MTNQPAAWHRDEQQLSFITRVFDIKVVGEVTITLADIDQAASLSIGQNRIEMTLDAETVELVAAYMAEGDSFPMPLVWKPTERTRRYVVLDGNHRIRAALVDNGDPSCPAVLIIGDSQLATRIAVVVNMQHGRTTRDPVYMATAMRVLREGNVPIADIARMFGVSEGRVKMMTRRDLQTERIRKLIPERHATIKANTLDLLSQIEDAHIRILGELFLDAPKQQQEDAIAKIKASPSALRDQVAHEIVGELRENERQRNKTRATTSRPASQLQGALQRLVSVVDPVRAYYQSTDHQKAIVRANLAIVMPRLEQLWQALHQSSEVA